jgi:cytochrome c-type biogenesis protein CcmH
MSLLSRVLGVSLLMLLSSTASAVIESHEFEDELLRARYQQLSAELRCPKCQNQNIADSNAPIAHDLREQLYAQLNAGRSDAEIVDYMVQRYGEFVMYRPRWSKVTMVLWLAPVILLGLALWVLMATLRRGKTQALAAPALTEAEQRRLDDILGEDRE